MPSNSLLAMIWQPSRDLHRCEQVQLSVPKITEQFSPNLSSRHESKKGMGRQCVLSLQTQASLEPYSEANSGFFV